MKIGTQNQAFFPENILEKFRYIKEMGFDGFEIDGKLIQNYDVDLLFFSFYCFSYSFNHLLVYAQENERNKKAISFCCMGRRHFNNSPICSRLYSPGGQSE